MSNTRVSSNAGSAKNDVMHIIVNIYHTIELVLCYLCVRLLFWFVSK